MAFTQRELEISNKSYTNKDFAAIYEELLTIAETFSDRISPSTAVETDPFIVVLKLAAIVADKVNFQVDKNLLERFISSCTQEQSMRELTETLGYNMHYYIASETGVVFNYKGSDDLSSDIIIPKYTVVESAAKIPYITTIASYINKYSRASDNVPVIQGKLQTLTVLGNNLIQLENLSSDNRLYFPEVMVAENGVFITNTVSNDWLKVDNLNILTYGSAAYKFGFDSKRNLPYIEFPDWISDIIGEGLTIDYVVTQGTIGNVAPKELNTIAKRTVTPDDGISNEDIRVVNLSAATSGADPETLDQSYLGFKKVIGTFDTLVTCRDYANAIYNMLTIGPVVSNVQVADRRSDLNYACDVATFDSDLGVTVESIPLDDITPFDLVVYPYAPITNTTLSGIQSKTGGFNKSFSFLDQFKINDITTRLENSNEYKTISHSFKALKQDDITSIQNYYELTATVNTTAKVNVLEQADIISNIQTALVKEFNARKLNFGHEIPYDELLMVMEKADARIKSVSLQEPVQTPKIITRTFDGLNYYESAAQDLHTYDPQTGLPITDTEAFKFIVAKNVLGGRASLYEYDKEFTYSYDYSNIDPTPDVKRITTTCNIDPVAANGGTYPLLTNEVIQFLAPSLITDAVYTAGIYYHLELTSGDNIPIDTDYQLKTDEVIKFYYKQNNVWKCDTFSAGSIVNSKTQLSTTSARIGDGETPDKTFAGDDYFGLLSGEEVSIKKINKEEITQPKKCYWITNAPDNEIKWSGNEYILQENEYFFYSDLNLTSLFAVGSGTKLTRTADTMDNWDWKCTADINIDDITLEGLYALNDAFKEINFSATAALTITENEIFTLIAGDTIKNMSTAGDFTITNNVFTTIGNFELAYKHKTDGTFKPLPDRSTISGANWSCRSLLDINCGPDLEQLLKGNQKVYYTTAAITPIDVTNSETYDSELAYPNVLKFNILTQRSGGQNLDLGYITINNLQEEVYPTLLSVTKDTSSIEKTSDGMYVPKFDSNNIAKFYAAQTDDSTPYMMIFVGGVQEGDEPVVSAYDSNGVIAGSTVTLAEGINIIKLEAVDATHWEMTKGGGSDTLFIISPIKYVKGINPLLGLKTSLSEFIDYMEEKFPEQFAKFYSIADLDPSKEIELSAAVKLDSAQAFYDSNNIANRWVLPKIDFSAIDIKIARSSTK